MFDTLSQRLQTIFKNLRGYGRLSESNIKDALREIKLALLEADVNYKVVKNFISAVREKAVGKEVLESITPGQQVVKIVHDELIALMGQQAQPVELSNNDNVIMLVGLQGSGKTTTAAKIAYFFRSKGQVPLLVALDVYRPAAVDQLIFLGKQLDIPVFYDKHEKDVAKITHRALDYAQQQNTTLIICDTAGRLHIDQPLMDELSSIKEIVKPQEIMLVVDAMTGQDALNSVTVFHKQLGITGVVLTKLDGDARGGAALSISAATGCPIRYIGFGEKVSDLDLFHPDRMASRILGMGDVVSLVEKARAQFDQQQAQELEQKIKKNDIDLEDFLKQLRQLRKMGPLQSILEMMPGMGNIKGMNVDEKQMVYTEAIIQSMTPKERHNPDGIDYSRKKRIANGSGTSIQEVNHLLKNFFMMKKMMKGLVKQRHKINKLGGKLWR